MALTVLANLAAGNQPLSIIDGNFNQCALLASPTFTGTPAAPTAGSGTNTTQLATTAFVQAAIGNNPQAWTPADNSAGLLTFTNISANWVQIGNMVFAYFHLTYPSTGDGSAVSIKGLPVAVPNTNYAGIPMWADLNGAASSPFFIRPIKNGSTFTMVSSTSGSVLINSQLTATTINGCVMYPSS